MYFGRSGAVGQRGVNFIKQNSDLLIAIGARIDLGQIGFNYKNFAIGAKKIVVDIDQSEIDKINTEIELPLNCSAADFITQLRDNFSLIKKVDRNDWFYRCRTWKKKYPVVLQEYRDRTDYVYTYVLVDKLLDLLIKEDIIVPGSSGTCSEITCQAKK